MIDDYDQDIFSFKAARTLEGASFDSFSSNSVQLLVHIDNVKLDRNLPNK